MAGVFQPPPTWANPILEHEDGQGKKTSEFNPVWLKWFVDLTALLSVSGGGSGSIAHNALSGLQGGSPSQFYHITQAQDTAIAAGITVVVPLAKLTAGGANGSLTFTNGILVARVAPT